jgi:hypothetical protein
MSWVVLVPVRDFAGTIRSRYGDGAAKKIQIYSIRNVCRGSPRKELSHSARRGHPAGRCRRISLLRLRLRRTAAVLGLINHDSSVPWTMFNVRNRSGVADPSASFPAQRFSFEDFAEDEENSVIV